MYKFVLVGLSIVRSLTETLGFTIMMHLSLVLGLALEEEAALPQDRVWIPRLRSCLCA